jgi:hypothetical protein
LFIHSITLEPDLKSESFREIGDHDFDNSKSSAEPPKNALPFRHKLLFTLLFSVILHALTFYIISLNIQKPSFKEDIAEPVIIRAKLYKPSPLDIAVQKPPEVTIPKKAAEVVEPQPITEPEVKKSKEAISEIIDAPRPIIKEPAMEPDLSKVATTQKFLTESLHKSMFSNNASKHIRQLNQNKQNSMASQAFKEYQYDQKHPEIKTPYKNTIQLTAEEQLQEAVKVKVDCNTAKGKVLSFISNHIGGNALGTGDNFYASEYKSGNIKCKKSGDINSFIKKRLEESNSLPPPKLSHD